VAFNASCSGLHNENQPWPSATTQQGVQTVATLLCNEYWSIPGRKNSVKANYRILKIIFFESHAEGSWVYDPAIDYDIFLIVNDPALVEENDLYPCFSPQY